MSEAEIPNPPNSSNDDFLDTDSLDELLASMEELTPSEESTDSDLEAEETDQIDPCKSEKAGEDSVQPVEGQRSPQLYEQNHQLLHRSAQLQHALETTQSQLEQHQWRLRQAEDLNAQQNDELNAAYEQNLSLSQELKASRVKGQQQEEKIAQLTHQLQVSQQRVAQLERECALIQKQFQEQSYKLCQAEKQSRELSLRLQQQRRHTWQFKSALNKCLETKAQKEEVEATLPVSLPSDPIPAWSSHQKSVPAEAMITDAVPSEPTKIEAEEDIEQTNLTEEMEPPMETMDFSVSLPEFTQTVPRDPVLTPAQNSPSPRVTAHRKKRKSYAAVELPKFNV